MPLFVRRTRSKSSSEESSQTSVRQHLHQLLFILHNLLTPQGTTFLALSLREEGYEVFANHDASGTTDELTRDMANLRMHEAGVQLLSLGAIAGELMRDWRNPDPAAPEFIEFMDTYAPEIGMALRGHRDAVVNGELMPGQEDLP